MSIKLVLTWALLPLYGIKENTYLKVDTLPGDFVSQSSIFSAHFS